MGERSDRVVLITGCSSGIGRALALEFLDRYRDPDSLYRDHVAAMEDRAAMSKNLSMPAADFARVVVAKVTRAKPPAVIKIGGGARLVPLLAMLPKKLLTKLLGKKFGLR